MADPVRTGAYDNRITMNVAHIYGYSVIFLFVSPHPSSFQSNARLTIQAPMISGCMCG